MLLSKILRLAPLSAGLIVSVSTAFCGQVVGNDVSMFAFVSISGTAFTTGQTHNGTNFTVTAPPIRKTISPATLLGQLALDEKTAGNWTNNGFPAGSSLVYYFPNQTFGVVNKKGEWLMSVSDIISFGASGQNSIGSGASPVEVPFPYSLNSVQLVTFTYDATASGGTTKYAVRGLGTSVSRVGVPDAKGKYSEFNSFVFQDGTGEGVDAKDAGMVVSGFAMAFSAHDFDFIDQGDGLGGFSISSFQLRKSFPKSPARPVKGN